MSSSNNSARRSAGAASTSSRPNSRPPSAPSRHRPDTFSYRPFAEDETCGTATSYAYAGSYGAAGRRSRSDTGPRLHAAFMLSPQKRFEDTHQALKMSSLAEERALREEMKNWYFGSGMGDDIEDVTLNATIYSSASGMNGGLRPDVTMLEEAAAAIKASVAAPAQKGRRSASVPHWHGPYLSRPCAAAPPSFPAR